MLKSELTLGLIGVVVVIGLLWYLKNNAANVAGAVVGAVGDAAAGAVVGIGQTVGIPATNATQCQTDLAAGDMWAASFSCDAGTYLKAVMNKVATTVNPIRSPAEAALVPPGFEQYQ